MTELRPGLHELPRIRDRWSYLYAEHCQVEQDERAIALHRTEGVVPVPCASLLLLMLGPGTTVSHAAMRALSDSGCLVAWAGEEGVRFYAEGLGTTRSVANLQRQARLASDERARERVAAEMYRMRFVDPPRSGLSLQQLRGMEGVRVREAYARASRESAVSWRSRSWDGGNGPDAISRALSWANSCLYGVCHAAIVAAGYSPGLGFIHVGNMRSFVFDVADLYKASISIPLAFRTVQEEPEDLESRVRRASRDLFREQRLVERILPDINQALASGEEAET